MRRLQSKHTASATDKKADVVDIVRHLVVVVVFLLSFSAPQQRRGPREEGFASLGKWWTTPVLLMNLISRHECIMIWMIRVIMQQATATVVVGRGSRGCHQHSSARSSQPIRIVEQSVAYVSWCEREWYMVLPSCCRNVWISHAGTVCVFVWWCW